MKSVRAKIYYRVLDPAEVHDRMLVTSSVVERWTDEPTAGRYVQDRHTRYTVLQLADATDAAVMAALKQKHPWKVVAVDQVEWLG